MRSASVLLVIFSAVVAGCATEPEGVLSPSQEPPPTTIPVPSSPTASPTPTDPDAPVAEAAILEEEQGGWTIAWQPGSVEAPLGSAIAFRATIRHDEPVPEASFSWGGSWVSASPRRVEIRSPETLVEGILFATGDPLDVSLFESVTGQGYSFEGPTVRIVGERASVPFESLRDVSADPPGLSVVVDGRTVRVTYAARANATTTADERVAAEELVFVEYNGTRMLVAFVTKHLNDAVADLPAPERPRVVAEMPDVPPGPLTVRVISRVSCFCVELPAPVVEERVVEVR